uniref:Uncharacterized protein n=1 Tax=Anguilla anguilla TaxID=7936 RepID=A0A0E9ULG3_ANGAN
MTCSLEGLALITPPPRKANTYQTWYLQVLYCLINLCSLVTCRALCNTWTCLETKWPRLLRSHHQG